MSALRIGLTGGIGSGKTTASDYFAALGVPIIDTDILSRELVVPGESGLQEIIKLFGDQVLDTDGQLNRDAVRELVFSDTTKRLQLEDILHPRIRDRATERALQAKTPYCLIVIPLLVETRYPIELDRILVIDTLEGNQYEWVAERDGLDKSQIEAVLASQASREERLAVADDVVINDGNMDHFYRELDKLHVAYLELASQVEA